MKSDLNDEYNAYAEIVRENLCLDTMLSSFVTHTIIEWVNVV